jgi:hypothetical protein
MMRMEEVVPEASESSLQHLITIGYRMQLFLQAKAAGLSGLNSGNLWAGKDSKKH